MSSNVRMNKRLTNNQISSILLYTFSTQFIINHTTSHSRVVTTIYIYKGMRNIYRIDELQPTIQLFQNFRTQKVVANSHPERSSLGEKQFILWPTHTIYKLKIPFFFFFFFFNCFNIIISLLYH